MAVLSSKELILLSILTCMCSAITNTTILRFYPTNAIVSEGDNATLTCIIYKPGVYRFEWNNQTSLVSNEGSCWRGGPLNTTKYNVTCNDDEDVQITIINVTRDRHGEVWECRRYIVEWHTWYESSSTITVNVPITHVVLQNMSSYTETIENKVTTFVCETSAGYPEASIRWYKDNTILTDVDVSSFSVLSNKYLKVVKSTLRLPLTRADNSSEIYCAATNTNTEWLNSSRILVIVFFGPHKPSITRGTNQVLGELNVIEGSSVDLVCTTVSYPESKYNWIIPNGTLMTGQRLSISPITRHTAGNYTCSATNVIHVSSGDTVDGENTTSVSVFVLYYPDAPSNFHYVEDLTTNSSITLSWKSGFDGGTLQTFILRYRVINVDESWNTESIVDTNSSIMNVTLQSLSSGVIYEISITASNAIGASKESNYIYVRTKVALKDRIETQHSNNIPIIVGGSVGGAGLLVGIIMCICLCRRRAIKQSDGILGQESDTPSCYPADSKYDTMTRAHAKSSTGLPFEELRMSTIEKGADNQYDIIDNDVKEVEYVNLNLVVFT